MKVDKSYSHRININDTTTNILQAKIDIICSCRRPKWYHTRTYSIFREILW